MKATVPLALAVAVIAFVYVEFTANFSFHWVTNGDLGIWAMASHCRATFTS